MGNKVDQNMALLSDEEKKAIDVLAKAGWVTAAHCVLGEIYLKNKIVPSYKHSGSRIPLVVIMPRDRFEKRVEAAAPEPVEPEPEPAPEVLPPAEEFGEVPEEDEESKPKKKTTTKKSK